MSQSLLPNLELGELYSKSELAELLNEPNLLTVREGLFTSTNGAQTILFFADLEKKGKEERFRFNDFFNGDIFQWDSQTTQHINSPRIQRIVRGEVVPHLFVRIHQKIKSTTQPFVYAGRLKYESHDVNSTKPVHMYFRSLDYDHNTTNENLLDIYLWKPETSELPTHTIVHRGNKVIDSRKREYKRPNKTERSGILTSRVGQGYYRQQILEKWKRKCPVTGCDLKEILIASHILKWSDASDTERLDPDNGILLSPNVDALFDKHLISFSDDGEIILSNKLNANVLSQLGIPLATRIQVSTGMKPYLAKHRAILYEEN